MDYRQLGRTGLEVSAIGLGTEHLNRQPREIVVSVIRLAVERGVNYFDLVFAFPEYLDNLRSAFQGCRDRVFLSAHLGSTVKNGQYFKSRSPKRCETFFEEYLSRLDTDHVDVLFMHNFNSVGEWEKVTRDGGALELAERLRQQGKARLIGISAHNAAVAQRAVQNGAVDIVMFPVNLFSHAMPGRKELLDLCFRRHVGLVAMKPFGGGKLLNKRGSVRVPRYQTGGEAFLARIAREITPVQCLSYTLGQVGVSLALPGVRSTAELEAALQTLDAAEEGRDFSALLADFGRYQEGECVYCNHCLPCPAAIDVGQVNRLLDSARWGITQALRQEYDALPAKASACTDCGVCLKRCPFGVDVVARIRDAGELFEVCVACVDPCPS